MNIHILVLVIAIALFGVLAFKQMSAADSGSPCYYFCYFVFQAAASS